MRHGHQACTDSAKAFAAQQVEGQGSQQVQHLNTVALAVAVGVVAEFGDAGPMPLVFVAARLLRSSTPSVAAPASARLLGWSAGW